MNVERPGETPPVNDALGDTAGSPMGAKERRYQPKQARQAAHPGDIGEPPDPGYEPKCSED